MANLFWKRAGKTISLIETPFRGEEEFERTVFETPELLEDIFLIKRQIRGGAKPGIPDIVGVDSDSNICIVELKNVTVDAEIIPQVLEYAIWAETNPDSIKSLWLEANNRPEELEVDWDDFDVRILIIAPEISRSTLQYIERINYPTELLEVKRWAEADNQLIMVNKLEPEAKKSRIRSARGIPTYDEAFYKEHRNKQSVDHFLRYAQETAELIRKQSWPLEMKFTKYHCAFKSGFFNVFAIRWMGSKTSAFSFKLPKSQITGAGLTATKYDSQRGRAYFYVDPPKTDTKDFLPLIELSYKRFAGG